MDSHLYEIIDYHKANIIGLQGQPQPAGRGN